MYESQEPKIMGYKETFRVVVINQRNIVRKSFIKRIFAIVTIFWKIFSSDKNFKGIDMKINKW